MVKEEDLTSECSSGCESGWTIYLQQSGECPDFSPIHKRRREEEEDLSMVSDASSGPPQQPHENGNSQSYGENNHTFFSYGFSTSPNSGKRRKVQREHHGQHLQVLQHHGGGCDPLDDTASSSYTTPKANKNPIHVNGSAHQGEDLLMSPHPSTLLKLSKCNLCNLQQKRSTWENRCLSYYLTILMSANQ